MFKRKTALVLGAGASWHYGYPTGEDLVKKVIQKATYAILYLEYSATKAHPFLPNFLGVAESDAACGEAIGTKWRAALARCLALKGGLEQVNPLVIDYYLGCDLPLNFHPAAFRASTKVTPFGAVSVPA